MDSDLAPETAPAARERLDAAETRVLGSLIEKDKLTPDSYPLSLNALVNACNQSTARDPVMALGDRAVEDALDSLRRKKLATVVFGAGSRVQKYRHNLHDLYNLDPRETGLLCVLLLRGPQTAGELRGRTERMASFGGLPEVDACLENLGRGDEPLVRLLPARPGQKERRYVQLLSGEPTEEDLALYSPAPLAHRVLAAAEPPSPSRLEALEEEVRALHARIEAMQEEFVQFRRQFE